MIRSRRIPPLLSRITGDGVTAALLVTSDGELLGSVGSVPHSDGARGGGGEEKDETMATTLVATPGAARDDDAVDNGGGNDFPPPPDMSDVGSLVAEVAGDYARLGNELQSLDPSSSAAVVAAPIPPPPSPATPGSASSSAGVGAGGGGDTPSSSMGDKQGGSHLPPQPPGQAAAGKRGAASLRCLIVELDMGLVGMSSVGPNCYIIALAEPTAEHGMINGRLAALSSHVQDALSQLAAPP